MVFHWLFDFYDESAENEQKGKKNSKQQKKNPRNVYRPWPNPVAK